MRQLFRKDPWIHPKDPDELIRVFHEHGTPRFVKKGYIFPHGQAGGDESVVSYLEKGLVFFKFPDHRMKERVFAIVPSGGVVGDLDAFTDEWINVTAETKTDCRLLVIPTKTYREIIGADIGLMRSYAKAMILKEEIHFEGLIANFTLPVEGRLISLFLALINSFFPVRTDDWNPLPIQLTTFSIADVIGSNRSTVSTLITRWVEAGMARRDGRRLLLHGSLFRSDYDWHFTHFRDKTPPAAVRKSKHKTVLQTTVQKKVSS